MARMQGSCFEASHLWPYDSYGGTATKVSATWRGFSTAGQGSTWEIFKICPSTSCIRAVIW